MSGRKEGWGAVVNEAMSSGCAVVADAEAGSVPYLIENSKDGFIYRKPKRQRTVRKRPCASSKIPWSRSAWAGPLIRK